MNRKSRSRGSLSRATRSMFLAGALLLVSSAAGWSAPARPASAPADFPQELDAYIARALRDWDIPGLAISVVRDERVLVARGYGVRKLGEPGRVDENTIFNVASLAKSFTTTAAAMLVDEGKLAWDEPVRTYLPGLEFSDRYLTDHVTLRDLLSHRTGLHASNMMWQMTGFDRSELVSRARYLQPDIPFRTGMVYSNVGYTLAGEVLAARAGKTYEDFVVDRVLRPLGMNATSVNVKALIGQENIVSPHAIISGSQRPFPWRNIDVIAPAGGINSTAADMTKWLRFHLGNGTFEGKHLVSPARMWEIHSPQVIIPATEAFKKARLVEHWGGYGLGWNVMDYRGHAMLWHSGNADGQPAIMAILPAERLGAAVLMNTWGAPLVHAMLLNRILDSYLRVTPRDWSGEALDRRPGELRREREERLRFEAGRIPGTAPSRPLALYAGNYENELYGTQTVRLEGNALTLQMVRGEIADLSHWHFDTFHATWRDPLFGEVFPALVAFSLDAEGNINGLKMKLNRDEIASRRQ